MSIDNTAVGEDEESNGVMRGHDQERAQLYGHDQSFSDTAGASIPRSPATAAQDGPALGMRPRVTIVVAAIIALAAITAVVALTWNARAARDNEDRLDSVVLNLNALQDLPWRLQTSWVNGGHPSAADIRTRMDTAEQGIINQLDALQQAAPVPGLAAARGPLAGNFTALSEVIGVIAKGTPTAVGSVAPSVFLTHDAVLDALDRARAHYSSAADGRLWEATIGSILVMALLLGGFVVFFWRSVKARTSAEALAAELERSREHLEHAQRIASIGSWEWDDRDHIVRWSPEQGRLHGWHRPEPPRTPRAFLQLIAPDDRRRVEAAMRSAFLDGEAIDFEYRVAESRGGRLIQVQASSQTQADGRRRVIGTSQDMTERFRRVEAERANRTKNEFISRMSHELRTPLNAVLGFGQLMSMSELDERQQGNVEHILSAGRHLLDLINEILDISRIESGDMRLSLEPVALESVLVDAADLVTPVADEHGIAITVEQEPDLWVRADVQRVRQVLLNLLSNAVKYNDDRGHVWVRARRADGGRVRIEVQDDGAGIAPEMMERLFSPFERLGAEQSAVEGTGLGLALSRGMIEAMGGRISVHSGLDEGSRFVVELAESSAPTPSDLAAVAAPIPLQRAVGVPDGSAAPALRVLCIEDNAANIELIEQILSARPMVELLTAQDGGSGLRSARESQPDLVLLDLDLPDIRGERVLAELRRDAITDRIPVVILSAATSAEEETERLLALGARSYISKPPGVTALLEAIDGIAARQNTAA